MRKITFALLLAAVASIAFVGAQEPKASQLSAEAGRGWSEPTKEDQKMLHEHGSRIKNVLLNLFGLRRMAQNYADKVPGSPPPPNGRLVRAPGKGVQSERYSQPPGDPIKEDELVNFPREMDNSLLPCFPPIFSQGPLNSCTSVAVTYYQLTHMTGLARGWDQKRAGPSQRFSPAWTFNLINNGNNLGAFQSRAYSALMAHGAATLKEMPYQSTISPATNYRRWPGDPKLWQDALEYRIESFGMIQETNVVAFIRRLKLLLINGHVLTAATAIDAWNKEVIIDNPRSRLDANHVGEFIATSVGTNSGNHCITIVGYNDDLWVDLNSNGEVDPGETGAVKIANSWGTGDWNKGFRWLAYSALYAPRDPKEAEVRQAGLYANQAFWITPSRDYEPEVVLQVDLPPLFRNEFSLAAGIGPTTTSNIKAYAPNFAFNYNGGRYGFDGKGEPESARAVLDLTGPARLFLEKDRDLFVRITRQGAEPLAAPHVRIVEPDNGAVHEIALTPTPTANTYVAKIPNLPSLRKPISQVITPPELNITGTGQLSVPLQIQTEGGAPSEVDVKVFSCNASILSSSDISVKKDLSGQMMLNLKPQSASGSCVLSVQTTENGKTTNSSIRVNLLGNKGVPPTITASPVKRNNLSVTIPFNIATPTGDTDNVLIFFDASRLDQIGSYEITGTGATRELTIELRYWTPFEVTLSAAAGGFVGTSRVKIDS